MGQATGPTPLDRERQLRHGKVDVRRRGIIAGAAALAAGLLAKQSSQSVGAADGGNLILGATGNANNTTATTTTLTSTATIAFQVNGASDGTAIKSVNNGANASSIEGTTDLGEGVLGVASGSGGATGGTGVHGQGLNPSSTGVYGESIGDSGVGVYGLAEVANSTAIFGDVYLTNSTAVGGRVRAGSSFSYGVYGEANAPGGAGVYGNSFDASSPGVYGQGSGGYGVQGISTGSIAVLGSSVGGTGIQGVASGSDANTIGVYGANLSTAPNSHGIVGLAQNGHGLVGTCNAHPAGGNVYAGLVGLAGVSDAAAGNFYGNVNVAGALFINGQQVVTGAKSAALAHPDGSHRLVYCVEAPESWLEDFGKGVLAGGKADIKIDPDFVAVADLSDYHIFLTCYGPSQGLDVAGQSGTGFSVQERNKGGSNVRFSWRIVAKRKDVKASRLAKFALPQLAPASAVTSALPTPQVAKALPAPKLPTRPRSIKVK